MEVKYGSELDDFKTSILFSVEHIFLVLAIAFSLFLDYYPIETLINYRAHFLYSLLYILAQNFYSFEIIYYLSLFSFFSPRSTSANRCIQSKSFSSRYRQELHSS